MGIRRVSSLTQKWFFRILSVTARESRLSEECGQLWRSLWYTPIGQRRRPSAKARTKDSEISENSCTLSTFPASFKRWPVQARSAGGLDEKIIEMMRASLSYPEYADRHRVGTSATWNIRRVVPHSVWSAHESLMAD